MRIYDMLEVIGTGGFADVWRVVLRGTDEVYALKLLRDYRDPDARRRFEREVRMIEGLRHPRVIRLVEANLTTERPFYVMPLMRGGSLTKMAGQLPAASVRMVLVQLLDFLAYLHGQGGLHRDIKPDNLLVDEQGNFAVGDFGLGNNPRFTVMMTAHAFGTYGYAAPELSKPGAKATSAADIYSLGATIFHLLTGIHPKDASTLDPWMAGAHVQADVRALVVQMVHPDPARRPSAREVLNRLAPPKPQAAPKPSPSNDGVKVLVGFGILAALVAALS